MLTLRAAATLLARADTLDALGPLAQTLGFTDPTPVDLSAPLPAAHALAPLASEAMVYRGPGALRLLTAVLAAPSSRHTGETRDTHDRERTRRLALAIAREAPTRHWCTITIDAATRMLCIATVTPHPHGDRIAALRVDRDRVVDSDAETLRALSAVPDTLDALRHARFTDILRRDALSTRFYRALDGTVDALATSLRPEPRLRAARSSSRVTVPTPAERRELALLCTSRCLFLAFLQAKGWLDGDLNFLLHHAASRMEAGGDLHSRLLQPLFFGTLNTPHRRRAPVARAFGQIPFLNGGLFSPTPLERRHARLRFGDDALIALIGDLLDRYRFTAREDSATWSEAAVDPEMLGRAFESLMASEERRSSGSFYTPPALVDDIVRDALHSALDELPADALTGDATPLPVAARTRAALRTRIASLRVLDPACGSGAFLVHTLERLAVLLARCGDPRPIHQLRRDTLTRSIFGVDRNPMAVWLCELRLWLSVVIECPETDVRAVPPLPNLDHHIRVGDTLAGGDLRYAAPAPTRATALRERYTRATGRRKHTLGAALDREERTRAVVECTRHQQSLQSERRALLQYLRTRDLFGARPAPSLPDTARLRELRQRTRDVSARRRRLELGGALPFRFAAHFAAPTTGFSLVIGNPPWVRPHAVPATERHALRNEFRAVRHAAWTAGARRAGVSSGFAAQADLAVAFLERSVALLAPGGTLALLLPSKLWRTLAGGGARRLLADDTILRTVRDWSDAPALFDAAVYPSLVVARRPDTPTSPPHRPPIQVSIARAQHTHRFQLPIERLTLGGDSAAPWILLPEPVRDAFEALRTAGPALGDSTFGRPTLGVKCGCNAAFLVARQPQDAVTDDSRVPDDLDEVLAPVRSLDAADPRIGLVERALLRPALRGESIGGAGVDEASARHVTLVARHRTPAAATHIIWTHGLTGAPLSALPPHAARWLAHSRRRLESRRDARAGSRWWTLFRTESARHDIPRLVWADIGRTLRTMVLPAGDPTVPLNTCYVLRLPTDDDAFALQALLSSPLVGAWLDTIAEPARGGFRRFLGWTIATLPVPRDWNAARPVLATLGRAMDSRDPPCAHELTAAATVAYGVTPSAVRALLTWHAG